LTSSPTPETHVLVACALTAAADAVKKTTAENFAKALIVILSFLLKGLKLKIGYPLMSTE
jgi:hypothetical protein